MFRNDGKGTFTDITDAAGLAGATGADLAVAPTDFDNGRDIDLIVYALDRRESGAPIPVIVSRGSEKLTLDLPNQR